MGNDAEDALQHVDCEISCYEQEIDGRPSERDGIRNSSCLDTSPQIGGRAPNSATRIGG